MWTFFSLFCTVVCTICSVEFEMGGGMGDGMGRLVSSALEPKPRTCVCKVKGRKASSLLGDFQTERLDACPELDSSTRPHVYAR